MGRWGALTEGNQTHENHLQFDKEAAEGAAGGMDTRGCSCDHPLMKGRRGRQAGCLASAHRFAWGGVGGDPFERGYVQCQAEQLVKREDKARRVFHPRCRPCTGVEEEVEGGMIRVVNLDLIGDFGRGYARELFVAVVYVRFRSSLADVWVGMVTSKSVCGACLWGT